MTRRPSGFEELYRAELAYVVRTLRRLGVAARDLEDLAHEVFVVVYRRRGDRDEGRAIRPWLFGIAYRVVGNYRQKAHRQREVPGDVERHHARPSPEEDVAERELRQALLDALDSLDLEHRAVAVLYEIEGLSAPEIAQALGIPLNTVYSRARNARLKLLERTRALRGGSS